MARPSKINQPLIKAIAKDLALGVAVTTCAEGHGISYQTYLNWKSRGEDLAREREDGIDCGSDDLLFLEFFDEVKKADLEAQRRWLGQIDQAAANGEWTAAAWRLERRFPNEFGKAARVEITGAEGGPIQIGLGAIDALLSLEEDRKKALGLDPRRPMLEGSAVPVPVSSVPS